MSAPVSTVDLVTSRQAMAGSDGKGPDLLVVTLLLAVAVGGVMLMQTRKRLDDHLNNPERELANALLALQNTHVVVGGSDGP